MKPWIPVSLALCLSGCASGGTSHVQTFFDGIYPLDAAVAIGAGILIYQIGNKSPWDVEVAPVSIASAHPNPSATTPPPPSAYRITLRRALLANGGDGESAFLFRQEAERIAGGNACNGYRILRYEERLETVYIGARRVAEGIVECVRS